MEKENSSRSASEFYIEDGKLISFEKWKKKIREIKEEIESEKAIAKEINKKTTEEMKDHGNYNLGKEENKTREQTKSRANSKTIEPEKEGFIEKLEKAVAGRTQGKCALMLSGGVDSSLLALLMKKQGCDFVAYTVGVEGSQDIKEAKEAAKELGIKHKAITIGIEIEKTIKELSKAFKGVEFDEKNNIAVRYGVGVVEYIGFEKIKKEIEEATIIVGAGIDEQAGGYQGHEKAEDVNTECWKRMEGLYWDMKRDCLIANLLEVSVRTPFLDKEVIKEVMMIRGNEKIVKTEGNRKIVSRTGEIVNFKENIKNMNRKEKDMKGDFGNRKQKEKDEKVIRKAFLRRAAEKAGLPSRFAWRKKKGAQYGSAVDKAIEKIARKKGMGKGEYLEKIRG